MHGKPSSYREFFLKKWADYVISNENWSVLQAKFINAQIKNIKSGDLERLKREEEIGWMALAEQSLKEVWDNPYDKRWDKYLQQNDKKLRLEYIKKLNRIKKEKSIPFKGIEELRKIIEEE